MDGIKTPELDKTFFIKDTEYRVTYKKDAGGKFSAEPHTKEGYYTPVINEMFMIDNIKYMVTYVHTGKRRITAIPISNGY